MPSREEAGAMPPSPWPQVDRTTKYPRDRDAKSDSSPRRQRASPASSGRLFKEGKAAVCRAGGEAACGRQALGSRDAAAKACPRERVTASGHGRMPAHEKLGGVCALALAAVGRSLTRIQQGAKLQPHAGRHLPTEWTHFPQSSSPPLPRRCRRRPQARQ